MPQDPSDSNPDSHLFSVEQVDQSALHLLCGRTDEGIATGVPIIGVLNNAMQLAGLPDFYQNLVKGAVLLVAVGFDTYQKSRKARETVERVAA